MENSCHWLLKTEPSTYSIQQLKTDKKTGWNGVRNFQARNFLQKAKPGDIALIYHSGDERAVVGVAKITRGAYPDPDPKKPGDWVQIEIQFHSLFLKPVLLKEIKECAGLKDLLLLKQSRLSVMPVSAQNFKTLCKMGGMDK
ncbi:MAG: EVE domain-containing protein [Candidatus Melainabacteria bacterium]|nr:EVE domain-containing protein [Candidatus Melainabacteria bacterium]